MGPFDFCYISSAAFRYISSAPPHLLLTAGLNIAPKIIGSKLTALSVTCEMRYS